MQLSGLLPLPTVMIPIVHSAVLIKLLVFKSIVPQGYLPIFKLNNQASICLTVYPHGLHLPN